VKDKAHSGDEYRLITALAKHASLVEMSTGVKTESAPKLAADSKKSKSRKKTTKKKTAKKKVDS